MSRIALNERNLEAPSRELNWQPLDLLLAPFDRLASGSDSFFDKTPGQRNYEGDLRSLPRYLYLGASGGGDVIRLGIFATIHGDEPEGALALIRFIADLEKNPDIARGYALFIYPVCNPTGFKDGTSVARGGKDLNQEFWGESSRQEVRYLEAEIWQHAFHGIINLHSDSAGEGIYGHVNGEILSETLIAPALQAAEEFLPRDTRAVIGGLPAKNGIISQSANGALRSVPGLKHSAFELTLEVPQRAPLPSQVRALNAALQTVLVQYRELQSIGQNI